MKEGILRGAYVLLEYAASYWLEHILRDSMGHTTSGCLEELSHEIEDMTELRKNCAFQGSYNDPAPVIGLRSFEKAPDVYETLLHIHSFLRKRWREFSFADGKSASRSMRSEH